MVVGAEKLKKKYLHLNEADEPVFKIYKDPRHTRVGRLLARTGLDELPQLINIIKGEMALVGPRPLPVDEAKKVPQKYTKRFSVLPGITSLWVVRGSHQLSFDEWMKLDLQYVENRSPWQDLNIMLLTGLLMGKWVLRWLLKRR
jgi:lipopolysaccharide/colanic/teichoic acid biosynthesis glycosyltransferase